jgi:hypothetical protein
MMMMTMWRRFAMAGAVLSAGCVFPLDVDVDGGHPSDPDNIVGSGRLVSETRVVAGFDAIRTSGVARVVIERTGREALRITAEDNILPHMRSVVENGTLVLGPRSGVGLSPREEILFHVEVAELRRIEGSGAVGFEAELGRQPELSVALSGVCVAEVKGSVDMLDVALSGVTGYLGLGLRSRSARVSASGVSVAHVWATERLDAWASGASAIRYAGDPAVYAHTSGESTVGRY